MASLFRSLSQWVISPEKSKGQLQLSGSSLFLLSSLLVESLIVLNLISSCQDTFDCRTFWPTISYLAAYRGHDRTFSVTMTLLAVEVAVFVIAAWTQYQSVGKGRVMLGCGLLMALLIPSIALVDEANSSPYAPLEKIHRWVMITVVSLGMVWTALSLEAMRLVHPKLPREQQQETHFLEKYALTALMLLCVTIGEWCFSTTHPSWLINENVEALCEWTVVSLAVFAPYFYSLTFPQFQVSFLTS